LDSQDETRRRFRRHDRFDSKIKLSMNRKNFLTLSGLGLAAAALPRSLRAAEPVSPGAVVSGPARTGNGEWVYETVPGWGALPAGETLAPTHGGFAWDSAGNLYMNTDGPSGTLVFGPDGKFLKSIAREYKEIHGMVIAKEGAEEFIYAACLGHKAVIKLRLDGTLVQKVGAPAAAGYKDPKGWSPTSVAFGPDGRMYVANGYGDSRVHIFDKDLNWVSAFGGLGTNDGRFRTCHGIVLDTRGKTPLLLVADRENGRLCHYDLEGKFVANRAQHLRRPCQISIHGKFIAVSELQGRVTILDGSDTLVAFLGDNPDRIAWANYKYPVAKFRDGLFNSAHGVIFAPNGDLYVSDWSVHGRVTKLVRVKG
jgi:hypothetical protein